MEKENYSEIIVEAMRMADKHLEKGNILSKPNEKYSNVWIRTFKTYARAAIEFAKSIEKSN